MTGFKKDDFENDDVRLKLLSIINDKLHIDVLKPFSKLSKREQVYFNEELNKYIQSLPEDNYLEVVTKDFNTIMSDVMTSDNFRPELYRIRNELTTPIAIAKDESVDDVLAKLETNCV